MFVRCSVNRGPSFLVVRLCQCFALLRVLFALTLRSRGVSSFCPSRLPFVLRLSKYRETSSSWMLRRGSHVCSP